MGTGRPIADALGALPLLRQSWRTVGFVHWPVPGAALRPLLPEGLEVDEHDGTGWVTLTPLVMEGVRPALPGLPAVVRPFPETNLRTYVVGPGDRRGVWFFSLDAAHAAFVAAARTLLGAPYRRADLTVETDGALVHYRGRRLGGTSGPAPGYRLTIERGQALEADPLDDWLVQRWRAYTRHAGQLVEVPVRHAPWKLFGATVHELDETLTRAAGVATRGAPRLAHFSEGVDDVEFGVPRVVGRRAPGVSR